MLKHLYKTLLISFMCGSLSIMNMTAYAQSTGGAGSTTSAPTMVKASSDPSLQRDANGVYKKTNTYSFEGTKGKEDNALNIITMLAVGFIGTRLLTYKKWTTDMSIVAAASAAYIAAEIINIMNLRKQLSDMNVSLTKSSDGKMDQAQIETIRKLRESYEAVLSAVKTRKMLQLGAAAIFAGAAAMAAYQRLTEEGQFASCEAGIISAEEKLAICTKEKTAEAQAACSTGVACAAATALLTEAANCTACAGTLSHLGAQLKSVKAKDEIPQPSLTAAAAGTPLDTANKAQATTPCTGITASAIKASFVVPSCTTYLVNKEINKGYGSNFVEAAAGVNFKIPGFEKMFTTHFSPENMSFDPTIPQRSYLKHVIDFFLPKAEAGMASMLGLGAGAALALGAAKLKIAQTVDRYMYTPGGRIIAWSIMTGAALLGASASQNEIENIEENIKKIDKILADLDSLQKGMKANLPTEQQLRMANFNGTFSTDLQLNPNVKEKTDCLLGSGGNCSSLENSIKSMPGFSDLPDSFKSIASQSAKIGDGLSGVNSISGSTMSGISSMASRQNAISKLANNLKTKLNDQLEKSGKPKIDFDGEEKKLLSKMVGDTKKALESKGFSGGSFLASAGLSGAVESHAKAVAMEKAKSSMTSSSLPAAAKPAGKDKSLDLDFKEAAGADAAFMAAGPDGAGAKDEKYDIGQNDINTNSNESIFEMISNRYIKSGYPKLLEEEAVKK